MSLALDQLTTADELVMASTLGFRTSSKCGIAGGIETMYYLCLYMLGILYFKDENGKTNAHYLSIYIFFLQKSSVLLFIYGRVFEMLNA